MSADTEQGGIFFELEIESGRSRWSVPCEHDIDKLLDDARVFISSTIFEPSPGVRLDVVAAHSIEGGLRELWRQESSGERSRRYDWDVVSDGHHVFVGRGNELVALDLESGGEIWVAPLQDLGGGPTIPGKWVPMVSEGRVVITLPAGTAAFSAETGERHWVFPHGGSRTVYGGRVYVVDEGRYYVLDLKTGECLLESPLGEKIEKKWRLKRVGFPTYLAISETHGFIGDYRGRLYAFERDTGEPVWKDQPEGITGFTGNIPVIAGNRLYISSFSMDPAPPPRLYCYEGAE